MTWVIAFGTCVAGQIIAEVFKAPRWIAVSIGWGAATLSLILQSHWWSCHP